MSDHGAHEPLILVATMPDVRPLASILRSLSFRNQATVKIGVEGLVVTVEEGRSLQAHAYISRDAFSSYAFSLSPSDPAAYVDAPAPRSSPSASPSPHPPTPPPYCQLTLSLSTVLECLNIFGNAGAGGGANPFKREGGREGEGEDEAPGGSGGGWRGGGRRRRSDEGEDGGRRGARKSAAQEEGKTTSLRVSYAGQGEPLVMLLEEGGIVTRCEITTYEPEGLLDLAFPDSAKVLRMIIKSDGLRDALSELPPSSEKLTFSFSPPSEARAGASGARYGTFGARRGGEAGEGEGEEEEEEEVPVFRIESVGTMGSTEMDYTDDKDVLETFECEYPIRNTYKFSHIQLTKHALASAIKVSIRTDEEGLISLQFMIPLSPRGARASVAEGKIGFVEFLCVPLDEY
ncbi:Rad1/Rec1/Rad17 [Rhodotorula diobovata]|uniref:Rad1/Rec1/Rad17 n=1 Tax=Rhodotorula diobovata TaxID=5288 RepID=A0A5C5FZ07_9BASI|nr:Rad1/Rec1/Rad17 [Rhodotorula diobovata]